MRICAHVRMRAMYDRQTRRLGMSEWLLCVGLVGNEFSVCTTIAHIEHLEQSGANFKFNEFF